MMAKKQPSQIMNKDLTEEATRFFLEYERLLALKPASASEELIVKFQVDCLVDQLQHLFNRDKFWK
jgi:hypothetical protein